MKSIWIVLWITFLIVASAMVFWKKRDPEPVPIPTTNIDIQETKSAYFAWGCFWCMEGIFEAQDGVSAAISGYIGGTSDTANYRDVSSWNTLHREGVQVVYDPDKISYDTLVELFWTQIDPTDEGGQFADRWYHYTTAIYYDGNEEKQIAESSKKSLEDSWKFEIGIATKILEVEPFYPAEDYHQDYYKKSALRYNLYKKGSGRGSFIDENWKKRIDELSNSGANTLWAQLEATYNDDELKKRLTPLQYEVTQKDGTEPPFKNEYWDNKEPGIYVDVVDGTPLYSSLDKFDSGTGWPSFTKPINEESLTTTTDTRFFMTRTEVRSASSDAHLGHIFNDAPAELWGIRHCINSASLRFVPVDELEDEWYEEYIEMFES